MTNTLPIYILNGPTASGKSALAMEIAQDEHLVIINCDSKQVYKEIPIITAQPTREEHAQLPHDLYGHVSAREHVTVSDWVLMAKEAITRVHMLGKFPLLVGGTGMYIKALMDGFSPMPDISPDVRRDVRQRFERLGNDAFYAELQSIDPKAASTLNSGDSQRITRAYEVMKQSGQSIVSWQSKPGIVHFDRNQYHLFFLNPDRQIVYERCETRFDQMLKGGVLDEIQHLESMNLDSSLPSMKAHGVPELLAYLSGNMGLQAAKEQAVLNTRHYIKRQFTWARNQMTDATVLDPSDALETVKALLH